MSDAIDDLFNDTGSAFRATCATGAL